MNSSCFDENEETHYAFLYQSANKTTSQPYWSSDHFYDGGGYLVDIGPKQSLALAILESLRNIKWIDTGTRIVFVESIVFNTNSRLFSHIQTVYEIYSFGYIKMEINVRSANLYPYVASWDFVILGFQMLMLVVICVRIVLVVQDIIKFRCKYVLSLEFLLRVLEIIFSIAAALLYAFRIVFTLLAVEKIFLNLGKQL